MEAPPKNNESFLLNVDKFFKLANDFISDIEITFPELVPLFTKWKNPENKEVLFEYCSKVYPERFIDILYENADIFDPNHDPEKKINVYFFPGVNFQYIWNAEISQNTKNTIWKYLQLILFTVVNDIHNPDAFGDTIKLFEAMSETEFKAKLEETMENIHTMFQDTDTKGSSQPFSVPSEEEADRLFEHMEHAAKHMDTSDLSGASMPDISQMHEHINSLIGGKLGTLAKEIAEESAKELNLNLDDTDGSTVKDVFKKMFRNPGKLMSMIKTIGEKLDSKMKSGEIKESELLEEMSDIMKKMKGMPGMENIPGMGDMQSIFKKMGGKGKMNMGGMESMFMSKLKNAKTKERMMSKLKENKEQKSWMTAEQEAALDAFDQLEQEEKEKELLKIFKVGEPQEKSSRNSKPVDHSASLITQSSSGKKKKNKK